ncbi:radical SAM protein [Metallosphaera hakonensis]|uniref:Radical SAM protein n=1 Tax=Metallosphaera hakonensis JCM 8857 = DSM 7519 TaxID=1293036 RepID=A0A2U9IVW1_9CREN|nr:radical SAM protein [Metallosphaera hakonensis]AWS00114.1 radical SAM protein [Metallosphaera hakonensis JCM 8857 = DSM 7519]
MRPIFFYAPYLKKYETDYLSSDDGWRPISVTGTSCAFSCKHCETRVLEGMEDGSTKAKFESVLERVSSSGQKGVILSGGSSPRGDVPIWKYTEVLKKYPNLTVIAHTGVVKSREIARRFKESGVKIGLLDMVGDQETIDQVLGQPFTVKDYLNSFRYLKEEGIKIAPHVIVGLSRKGIEGDLHALELLSEVNPDAVIIVGLMPLVGTPYKNTREPSPEELAKVLLRARELFSNPVMLGCARPRGKAYISVERLAVDQGIDGMAFPSEETIEYAKDKREVVLSHACCGNVIHDFLLRVSI